MESRIPVWEEVPLETSYSLKVWGTKEEMILKGGGKDYEWGCGRPSEKGGKSLKIKRAMVDK